jgi:nodulation protein E
VRRVVVTGLGVIAPGGKDIESFFSRLAQGQSAVQKIAHFDPNRLTIQIAAEVPEYRPEDYFSPRRLDLMDRFTQFALIAAQQAMKSSEIEIGEDERARFGVVVGSGMGGVHTFDEAYFNLYGQQAARLHPLTIPKSMHNAPTSQICMEFGARGPSLSISTACSSANHAIGEAFHLIKHGVADLMLAGGSDAPITLGMMRCWESMRVLAPAGSDARRACRPFSADREGMVIGEGAGMFLLEEIEHARRRGALIFAEVVGYGLSSDAMHVTQPSVDGPVHAMRMALTSARLNEDQIDYINAHGTGTRLNDAIETKAIKKVFGSHAHKLAVSSTKSMHGHAMGAAGAIELVATIMALHFGLIPPTANYSARDPECDLDYVVNQAREKHIRTAISNSFAFGGLNAVILVSTLR